VDVAEGLVVALKIKNRTSCPICDKEVFSGVGSGCKMCGMLVNNNEFFCCKLCMRKYNTINKYNRLVVN
jgi:hypothetical protein